MKTEMTTEEQRILNAVEAFDPLQDPVFCDEVQKSHLLYDDENLPRVYAHMRTVAEIWKAKDQVSGPLKAIKGSRAAEPNFHTLVADCVSLLKEGSDPDWHRIRVVAENCMHVVRDKFCTEKGWEEFNAFTRTEYLRAIEQLTKTGFSGDALIHLAHISGLAKARRA